MKTKFSDNLMTFPRSYLTITTIKQLEKILRITHGCPEEENITYGEGKRGYAWVCVGMRGYACYDVLSMRATTCYDVLSMNTTTNTMVVHQRDALRRLLIHSSIFRRVRALFPVRVCVSTCW